MTPESFQAFEAQALTRGFDAAVARDWAPGTIVPTHTHPFAVKAVMVQGEMWLTMEGRTRHLKPGDWFELAAEVPHDERYGPEGATYWVARRHAQVAP